MKHPAVHICLVLLAILSAPSLVAADCLEGDCRNGKGVFVHKDGRRYQGEFKNGVISGTGTLTLPNGVEYSGQFRNGRLYGVGRMTGPKGLSYEGEFRDNLFHGKGDTGWW